jgi:hypothetical protein
VFDFGSPRITKLFTDDYTDAPLMGHRDSLHSCRYFHRHLERCYNDLYSVIVVLKKVLYSGVAPLDGFEPLQIQNEADFYFACRAKIDSFIRDNPKPKINAKASG